MKQNIETVSISKDGEQVFLTKKEFDYIVEEVSKRQNKHENFYFSKGGFAFPKDPLEKKELLERMGVEEID